MAGNVPTSPRVYNVTSDVSTRKGPNDSAEPVSVLAVGATVVVSDWKKKGGKDKDKDGGASPPASSGGAWGRVVAVAVAGAAPTKPEGWLKAPVAAATADGGGSDDTSGLVYTGSVPEAVKCPVCGTEMQWGDWVAHRGAKKHRSKFEKNAYNVDVFPTLESANAAIEAAALLDDASLAAGLQIETAQPSENCGRWMGPPPSAAKKEEAGGAEKKAKKAKKKKNKGSGGADGSDGAAADEEAAAAAAADEEEVPLTEAQLEWKRKTEERRSKGELLKRYNEDVLPTVVIGGGGEGVVDAPAWGAGRGRRLQ